MATAAQIRAEQGNQVTVDFDPVWLGSQPYNLAGVTLTAYVKPSDAVPDDDPAAVVITSTPGPGGVITVTNPEAGLATLIISGSVLAEPGTLTWRLDATSPDGSSGTVAYGPVYVEQTG